MEKGRKKGKKTTPRSRARQARVQEEGVRVGRRNVLLFGLAIAVIILGFGTLAMGSTALSAILLVVGYLVLVPWAIVADGGSGGES